MEWLRYTNQGAIRNRPLSNRLINALSFVPEMGLTMEVFSGGQPGRGSGGARTGSTRHDHGHAADAFFMKDGKRLDWANPKHRPIFEEIVSKARAKGVTGIGAGLGYMQPGSMHLGFGNEAVWGAEGKGVNAPDWLRASFYGRRSKSPTAQDRGGNQMVSAGGGTHSLLGNLTDNTQEKLMQTEQATGLLGSLFPDMTEERADRIRLGLNSLSMFPNELMMESVRDRMEDRRIERVEAKQGNKTAAWLATQPGGQRYAEAITHGAMTSNHALKLWSGGQDNDRSAKEKSISRIKSAYGVSDQEAVGIVDGVLRVSRDPYDQSVVVTNLATGESYSPKVSQTAPSQPPAISTSHLPAQTNSLPEASSAFGIEGTAKSAINSVADTAGLSVPFEDVQTTISDFATLRESLINDIASGYNRQPPSWLLQNIRDLTPAAGGLQGAGHAQSKLESLRRSMITELETVAQQSQRKMSPAAKQDLEARMIALDGAVRKIDGALGRFGVGQTGTTNSGVKWRIEQ